MKTEISAHRGGCLSCEVRGPGGLIDHPGLSYHRDAQSEIRQNTSAYCRGEIRRQNGKIACPFWADGGSRGRVRTLIIKKKRASAPASIVFETRERLEISLESMPFRFESPAVAFGTPLIIKI